MKYRLIFDVYGGEYIVGTTDWETAEYWDTKDEGHLIEHMVDNTLADVPEKHSLFPYYEQNNLIHTSGVELNELNYVKVINEDTGECELEVSLGSFFIRELCYMVNDPMKGVEEDQPVVYFMSSEKGSWEYIIDTDDEFDPKKLKFYVYDISQNLVVSHITYDDEDCELIEGTTRGISLDAGIYMTYDDGSPDYSEQPLLSYLNSTYK